ncbi:MAG TPA: serine/threonine-protein kinase [Pyrinomonadaceae bacterium]|jgi:serine/threonine-protein kinase|nr:serine/threonine-protein kinase [Pyrinomonadaceae bacterium]
MTPTITCFSCSKEIPRDSSICPSCGAEIDEGATRRLVTQKATPATTLSFNSIDNSRFVPGAILAARYRIVGLLGKGGMGEVYRADDLKLGQPVALKFLPDNLLDDGAALARFHREVRVARQVSHKNVCRVYDIGEVDGRHFLSMEYIKGEELSSLLHRIGSLPQDKAIQLARQICAGLAAAHDAGVLHRDLKPANIMIDGDGNARILDFGLAGLSEEFGSEELAAGTPAYMAPEQLEGREQTVKTDIYSLGLVLYELFTAKRAFAAANLHELLKLRRGDTTPTSPSTIIKDLDPLIEKVIDRCIQRDADQRPESALQVAAALPGGDPIAAALAAGETPSPEMVAAASTEGALRPAVVAAMFAVFLVMVGIGCWSSKYISLYRMTPLNKSPDVLAEKAREITAHAGFTNAPADSAYGMTVNLDYLQYVAAKDRSPSRWEKLRNDPAAGYRYWYRQSPRSLEPPDGVFVNIDEPPLTVSGMAAVNLDMAGQLHYFIGVPPQRDENPGAGPTAEKQFDWSTFFSDAGLDQKQFQVATPSWVPLHQSDQRMAWNGLDPANPEYAVHVEAASFHGRPVYFETIYPWDHPTREREADPGASWRAAVSVAILVFIVALIGSALLALRNLRVGLGDRRGAFRLAAFYFLLRLVWLVDVHHVSSLSDELTLFIKTVQSALFGAAFLWLLYLALEPLVRRHSPRRIISWSRALAGDWRDPLVGRDVLIGAVAGSVAIRVYHAGVLTQMRLASPTGGFPQAPFDSMFLGWHFFVIKFSHYFSGCLFISIFLLFLFLIFFLLFRRELPAAGVICLVVTGLLTLILGAQLSAIPFALVVGVIMVGVLYRFGLLALVSTVLFYFLPVFFPQTTELTAWYATDFTLAAIIMIGLAAMFAYTSLAGQALIKGGLLGEKT